MESSPQMPLAGLSPDVFTDGPLEGPLQEEVRIAGVELEGLPVAVDPYSWCTRLPSNLHEGRDDSADGAFDSEPRPRCIGESALGLVLGALQGTCMWCQRAQQEEPLLEEF